MRILFNTVWAVSLVVVASARGAASDRPTRDASDPALVRVNDVVSVAGTPFTGEIVDWYAPGVRRSSTLYVNGRRDGDALTWYPNGQLTYDTRFREGREEGVATGWWADGRTHFVYRFSNGLLEGEAREWFPDGTPYRVFHYLHGQESGAEQMWYLDGRMRANYVVRDGRRYGLPGTKGCTGATTEPGR